MKVKIPEKLNLLAESFNKPLYVVGGYVRNALINGEPSSDVDIAGAIPPDELLEHAEKFGFKTVAVYKRTGTALLVSGNLSLEYAVFRKERYKNGGEHTPCSVTLSDSLEEDALRRDFRCNAVYYDVKNDKIIDATGGVNDIKNRKLNTVLSPEITFSNDGLRLLRLARFAGELNFAPTEETLIGAKAFAANITYVSAERIYAELLKILNSDRKYPFSDKFGHYRGLKILSETGVLDYIIPEITAGRGMAQRADYHNHDVLEHSLRAVKYAPAEVRLAALLHDSAKPYCKTVFGKYGGHDKEGIRIAANVLQRLKAPASTVKETAFLVGAHMKDLNGDASEIKVRRFIADNSAYIPKLLKLKQADFSAGKDSFKMAPTVEKWQKIYNETLTDGTPFSVKELKIGAEALKKIGYSGPQIGAELKRLKEYAVSEPKKNNVKSLTELAERDFNKIKG